MTCNVDINLDYRTPRLGYNTGFTLTVKAVNDAPIALHPMKESYLSWDVAMVLNTLFMIWMGSTMWI